MAVSEEISLEKHDIILLNEENIRPDLLTSKHAKAPTDGWYLDNGASNHMTGD